MKLGEKGKEYIFIGFLFSLLLLDFTLTYFREDDTKCDKVHLDEWTPARDPVTKGDSVLIERTNFFVMENIRLENYIKELEKENQRFSSMLAEIENEKGGHEILKKLWNK